MNLQRNWGGRTLAVKAEMKYVHIFGNEGRSEMWNYRSFAVNAEGKCGGGTSHIWQWRQSVSEEADLQIFGSQDWAKVQKRNCKSLEVQAEMKCGSGTSHLVKSWQNKCGKRNFRSLPVKAERKRGSRLHIFGSKGRAEVRMRKRNFTFLAVNAERKCGRGTSDLCQSRQSGNVEAEHQVFGSRGRAEVWKRNFRSLAVKTERKCSQALWQPSQVGRAGADLNSFDRPISYWLSLPVLKNNSTDCYIEGQCEDQCAWQGQYAPARALGNTGLSPFLGPSCRVRSPSSRRIGPL